MGMERADQQPQVWAISPHGRAKEGAMNSLMRLMMRVKTVLKFNIK